MSLAETARQLGQTTDDWQADGDFTSADLVVAFQDGGYEQGPRSTTAAVIVPEPSGLVLCLLSLGGFMKRTV